jgi:hypothetical protein
MERAQDLACKRYLGTQENFIQIVAIDAFLKGCLDKKADTDSSKPETVLDLVEKKLSALSLKHSISLSNLSPSDHLCFLVMRSNWRRYKRQ